MIKKEATKALGDESSKADASGKRQALPGNGRLPPREKQTATFANLVLASGSPAKISVLDMLGLRFQIDPADIDEKAVVMPSPEELVCELAFRKAVVVSRRHPDSLVLGADTLVVDDAGFIGKPRDTEEAEHILRRLSGKSHRVITGLVIVDGRQQTSVRKLASTTVTFRRLAPETVSRYVSTGEPLGKAGAYAIQGIGGLLVERVEGEYNNVLGLPIATLVDALSELGYELL